MLILLWHERLFSNCFKLSLKIHNLIKVLFSIFHLFLVLRDLTWAELKLLQCSKKGRLYECKKPLPLNKQPKRFQKMQERQKRSCCRPRLCPAAYCMHAQTVLIKHGSRAHFSPAVRAAKASQRKKGSPTPYVGKYRFCDCIKVKAGAEHEKGRSASSRHKHNRGRAKMQKKKNCVRRATRPYLRAWAHFSAAIAPPDAIWGATQRDEWSGTGRRACACQSH